jgi:Diacylglycerol kinase catalytic domain
MAAASADMRPCLLVNPRSFRASRLRLAQRAAGLAAAAGLDVHEVTNPGELGVVLDRLRAQRQRQIWMLVGDGMVHALAEFLAAGNPDDWSPELLLLAGGRANVVPRECGGYPAMPALRRALAALAAGRPLKEERIRTLRVSQAGQPVRHGFLLTGSVLYEGVRLCAAHRAAGNGWLHRGFFADPYVLLKLSLQVLVGRSPLPPYPDAVVQLPGQGELAAPLRILVASSLNLGGALYNPFAARGTGPVRLTAVDATAHFWRHLRALLRGRFDDNMDLAHGFLSGRGESAQVCGIGGYALDGETFSADPDVPVVFSPGFQLRVLRA